MSTIEAIAGQRPLGVGIGARQDCRRTVRAARSRTIRMVVRMMLLRV